MNTFRSFGDILLFDLSLLCWNYLICTSYQNYILKSDYLFPCCLSPCLKLNLTFYMQWKSVIYCSCSNHKWNPSYHFLPSADSVNKPSCKSFIIIPLLCDRDWMNTSTDFGFYTDKICIVNETICTHTIMSDAKI